MSRGLLLLASPGRRGCSRISGNYPV